MVKRALKYAAALLAASLAIQMVFGAGLRSGSHAPRFGILGTLRDSLPDSIPSPAALPPQGDASSSVPPAGQDTETERDSVRPTAPQTLRQLGTVRQQPLPENYTALDSMVLFPDYIPPEERGPQDTARHDSVRVNNFLDDVISGKNKDSLVYRPKEKLVYIYNSGDVTYGNMNMQADFMRVELDTKQMYATGVSDTLGNRTRPVFVEGGSTFTMDTILYNFKSGKAKIKGVATQEGEGFLLGDDVKKMPDNSINISSGKYTTCDQTDHPHFYLGLTKAKVIPQKKVIIGPAYLVMEDVPLPIAVPEGFFPLTQGRSSGIIIPSYGEETTRGFFLRDGGYYWAASEHMDLTLLGSIYTYGSWELSAESRYVQRYKYSGRISGRYAKTVIGEPGDANYVNSPSFQLQWTHQQDPKFNPGSTFSASVNFATSGFRQYASTSLNDYVSTTTESSISYGKSWAGTPFSLQISMRASVNSRDSTIQLTLPSATFNMSKVFPFRRKNAVGKQRWYEKISVSYTGSLTNSVKAKEDELLSPDIFDKMVNGIQHKIPVSTSFNLFNYINVSPSFNYNAVWLFREVTQAYDPDAENHLRRDTTYGFHHLNDYNFNVSANTKVYGTYDFTRYEKFPLKMLRHTITPTIGFRYTPNFGSPTYGYWEPYQTSEDGKIDYYSPYSGNAYSVPSRSSHAASLTFSVAQTLEAKVASKRDTSGMKKVKIIDNFSFSGSYNFLADSMKLSTIPLSLRMTIPGLKNFGINISATLDPYDIGIGANGQLTRINKLMIANGKGLGRITNASTSIGYTFNSGQSNQTGQPAINNSINTQADLLNPFYFDPDNPIDPLLRRQMMSATYYDFSIPWNLTFNYSISYSNQLARKNIVQTLSYSGSVNLTPKWGITLTGSFDFETGKLTTGVFTLTRDLHCWQMSFSWVPTGARKSWQFNISVKAAALQDLKYDKHSSYLDNIDWGE